MIYTACVPERLYTEASWSDEPALLSEMVRRSRDGATQVEFCSEVYPAYGYERDAVSILGGREDLRLAARNALQGLNRSYRRGPASALVRLADACLSRTIIYLLGRDAASVLWETHRPGERDLIQARRFEEMRLVDEHRREDPFVVSLWLGSAGFGNPGHWLVDDLPRLRALTELRRMRPYARIRILMLNADEAQNRMRAESCGAICHRLDIENWDVVLVDPDAKLFFDELYYVTPVTQHPMLKSPDAMRFVAEHGAPEAGDGSRSPRRILVSRPPSGTGDLVNQDEIAVLLEKRGFVSVDPTHLSHPARARLFRDADYVIGSMEAAMAGTVFCREGARIGYLAPEGWAEPFFWDLAATRRHRHATCFGHAAPGSGAAWQKNHRINPRDVETMLQQLDATPAMNTPPAAVRDPFRIWN